MTDTSITTTVTPDAEQLDNRFIWLEALRGGDYKQAKGKLYDRDHNGFCCLGVAAAVLGVPFILLNGSFDFPTQLTNGVAPSTWMADKFGLTLANADALTDAVVPMNDIKGASFETIANRLEELFAIADDGRQIEDAE